MVAYSYKERFVAPIAVGLGIEIPRWPNLVISAGVEIRPKRQTIRAVGLRRHARPGETLQLYYGMRTKQCRKIGDARCTDALPIKLWFGRTDELGVDIAGDYFCGSTAVNEFARSDGFENTKEMVEFWRKEHASIDEFEGVLIRWEPLEKDGCG